MGSKQVLLVFAPVPLLQMGAHGTGQLKGETPHLFRRLCEAVQRPFDQQDVESRRERALGVVVQTALLLLLFIRKVHAEQRLDKMIQAAKDDLPDFPVIAADIRDQ